MGYYDKDMLFTLINTDTGIEPSISSQHWSESKGEWLVTGEENPLPIIFKNNEEFKQSLSEVDDTKKKSNDYLTNILDTMNDLIENSN